MAQKPNKKANQGKPVYKPRQQPPAQAQAPAAAKTPAPAASKDGPPKGEKVNWQAMMDSAASASNQSQNTVKPNNKPAVDFAKIHQGGKSDVQTAFQSTVSDASESASQPRESGRDTNSNYRGNKNHHGGQQHYQQRNTGSARHHEGEGGRGRGQGGRGGRYHDNNNRDYHNNQAGTNDRGRGGHQNNNQGRHGGAGYHQNQQQNLYNNPQALIGGMTPQMLANQPQLLTHTQNMQQMELSEIESLFTSICSQIDPELLQQTLQSAGMPLGGRPGSGSGPQMMGMPGAGRGGKGPGGNKQFQQNQNNQGYQRGENQYGQGRGGKKYQASNRGGHQNNNNMPMPGGKGSYQKMESADFPAFGQGGAGSDSNRQKMVYQAKKPANKDLDGGSGEGVSANPDMQPVGGAGGSQTPVQPFFTNAVQMNLCQEHFPEPIMMFNEKPLCKKCIQEQFMDQQAKLKKMSYTEKAMSNVKLLGLQHRPMQEFQSEKQKITRSVQRLDNFKKQFRYIEDDIKQREQMSAEHMRILTPLMNSMFDKLEELQMQGEQKFKTKIFQIVRNQQRNIQDDMKSKLPTFYNRLMQKYNELQQASNLAQQRGAEELIETLKHFETIFIELDAEYEKYFNDYEKMSKLQRLLDKDANEIVQDFTDVVERNLRVDYNIKSSFGPQLPQRLHSFQWNQKCVQLYRLKTGLFEKKQVQMTYDVPLYSRSIATESGTIYLTGGYVKHMGVYLKNCYRYDDLFGILNQVSHMNYPHADHSICTIQNFIYVIGTFVGNQVYGYCEVYDTQKDQWKLIADMRVPRTGTSLTVFKNNYIFAFGGRVDQKRIVDTIEVYDISRNVWQEICAPKVDKSGWVPSYMGLAHQITDNEIILFGGKSALTFHIFNGCFVFDVEKMEIRERGSLVNPCSFMNTPLVFNHSLYAYGNDIYIHQYNIPEQKWSVIPKSSVVLPKA